MNFHEVCNIYGYNKSTLGNLKEGTKKNINWNNVIVDTTSGRTVGVIAGTGLGIGYIVAVDKTYEYDKRGNLIGITDRGKRVRAYEYDITGRLGLSYSKSGKARSHSYDGLGNRIGIKEYEFERGGYGESKSIDIFKLDLSQKEPIHSEEYVLDRTRAYHNLLQNKTIKRGSQAIQNYVWDFNVAYMEEGEKEFTYLQDELGSTIRLLEQGGESQAIYGYGEFGEDTYNTQGQMQPFGYTGYIYDNVAGTYFAQAREYVPGVGRFAGEDWIKGNIEQPFSLNWYGYCFGNPLVFVDRDGKLAGEVSIRNLPRGLNEKNIRMFLGLSENEVIPKLKENQMYVLENTKSVGLAIVGRGIVMDNDKYCEYSFGGFGKSMGLSSVIDYTETKGYVYNVKNPEDYSGFFIGGSINLTVGVEGGAVAPVVTLNPVYSEIIAGEGLGGGEGVGITWYKQLSEGWVYGEAPINWHNPRLSYPFGSGSLIANSNNFCQSSV